LLQGARYPRYATDYKCFTEQYDFTQNYLLFICKLKIQKHDVILHNDVILKQTRCICVSKYIKTLW